MHFKTKDYYIKFYLENYALKKKNHYYDTILNKTLRRTQ